MPYLSYANKPSTGESKISDDHKDRMFNLNNNSVSESLINEFFSINKIEPCDVNLSQRKTKRRWGTAWQKENRITLYRHSIGMFLHELAHIIAVREFGRKGKGHNFFYWAVLEGMIDTWETTPFSIECLINQC